MLLNILAFVIAGAFFAIVGYVVVSTTSGRIALLLFACCLLVTWALRRLAGIL